MKKALLIVAAVAVCSLFETGLLLTSVSSLAGFSYPSRYQVIVWTGQFLLIPGLAALFSRIMYGPYELVRRTLTILLAGSLGVPIAVLAGGIGIGLPLAVLFWAGYTSKVLFAFLLPVILGGVLFGFRVAVRRSGKWSVRAETARWWAERQSGVGLHERRWRNRGIRVASGIPLTIVLVVFLFLPESWGILSWLTRPRLHNLSGYQVSIPATWIILNYGNQPENGWSSISGVAGRGIGRGGLSLSSWDVGTIPTGATEDPVSSQFPNDDQVIGRRAFTIGPDNITCLEHRPTYLYGLSYNRSADIYVTCSGTGRFHARMTGPSTQVEAFYEVLGRTTHAK